MSAPGSSPTLVDLQVSSLGETRFDSPLARFVADRHTGEHYVHEDDRVLFHDTVSDLTAWATAPGELPSFEPGGPRSRLFFEPGSTSVGIVTCGGLCPGLNDVIRGLVMELNQHYGVRRILGFRNGYAGLAPGAPAPVELTPSLVASITATAGTVLGSSRGAQDLGLMADRLVGLGIDILFVVGGDGSIRGAGRLADVLRDRQLPISVIGIPKTIDNDIPLIGQSFGFVTAFSAAAQTINAAMVESKSALGGVGLVKLMGRHAGFIACYAALAGHEADFVLIPEVPFTLTGGDGLLAALHRRVITAGSAVVIVAEGAGQELCGAQDGTAATDASGNAVFGDVGAVLKSAITDYFDEQGTPLTLKYLDPGYQIRSVPAHPHDSVYCVRLAQAAVHAGMAGRTDMVVGRRHNRFIHVPIAVVTATRNQVAPDGDLWLSVLESTAQPVQMR